MNAKQWYQRRVAVGTFSFLFLSGSFVGRLARSVLAHEANVIVTLGVGHADVDQKIFAIGPISDFHVARSFFAC
eukprot:TRINITY_DN4314_c0_g1_i1.p2 TRINITY_DN4314_c0_g1~~TRINITY_DN4314_c0_g1_i1.p2  ORF type:complete len:87 (-),score=38.68 TRINITY_DN4314_c0_g1_i1:134-355(-)